MRFLICLCDPCRIQTCNPHIRSVVLYSVELMDPEHSPVNREKRPPPKRALTPIFAKAGAKVLLFFELTKFLGNFFSKNCIFLISSHKRWTNSFLFHSVLRINRGYSYFDYGVLQVCRLSIRSICSFAVFEINRQRCVRNIRQNEIIVPEGIRSGGESVNV